MCKAMEDRITDEKIIIAVRMLSDRTLTKEQIAKLTSLPIEKIEELATQLSSVNA